MGIQRVCENWKGEVLWHLHQEIVHRGAEQIQEKIQRAVLQRAHRREQKDQPPIQEAGNRQKASRQNVDIAVKSEVMLIVIFAAAIFMFLCIIGVIHGAAATGISNVMFGVFGLLAYLIPVIIFVGFAFGISNKGNTVAIVKMVSGVILIFLLGILSYMLLKQEAMLNGKRACQGTV